jgi:hypothetical protein
VKRHQHEEHQNHERWVISYADMITLLFALFVVLYALGLDKLEVVAKSIAFAFHYEGEGKTKEEGMYNTGHLGGGMIDGPPLMNSQMGPMKELLLETMPEEYQELTGNSLSIVVLDDTVAFKGRLSDFFPSGRAVMHNKLGAWLSKLLTEGGKLATNVRVRIDTPNVRIGTDQNGLARFSHSLCYERLDFLLKFLRYQTQIAAERIQTELRLAGDGDLLPLPPGGGDWEQQATVTFAFTNQNLN